MRLNSKKTKSMVINRSRINALGYGDLTPGDADLEEVESLRILGVTLDSKLTLETQLREVVSKPAKNLGVVHRKGKLVACPRVLKCCFNA